MVALFKRLMVPCTTRVCSSQVRFWVCSSAACCSVSSPSSRSSLAAAAAAASRARRLAGGRYTPSGTTFDVRFLLRCEGEATMVAQRCEQTASGAAGFTPVSPPRFRSCPRRRGTRKKEGSDAGASEECAVLAYQQVRVGGTGRAKPTAGSKQARSQVHQVEVT